MRIQTAILIVLISALVLMTAAVGQIAYSELYASILRGFDGKLQAISSTCGAFIKGEDHDEIYRPKTISGLAFDVDQKTLYGLDGDRLVKVDPDTGEALTMASLGFTPEGDLAFDARRGRLLAVDGDTQMLVSIDPETASVSPQLTLADPIQGLAFMPGEDRLMASGESLWSMDLETMETTWVGALDARISGLAWDPAVSTLYGVDAQRLVLVQIDPKTAVITDIAPLESSIPPDSETLAQPTLDKGLAYGLALSETRGTLFTGHHELQMIQAADGKIERTGVFGFRNEQAPLFLHYVEPMRHIRENLDLTFLYTLILGGDDGRQIIYVIDSNTDENHTNIGYEETDPADEGMVDVVLKDKVHLSKIEFWEEWGLFKCGFSPLYDKSDEVTGMAGADVNVSVITKKTHVALFKVFVVGFIAVALGSLLALTMVRRLTKPLDQLKNSALQVAAGRYGQNIEVNGPRELTQLTRIFNAMSQSLHHSIEELTQSTRQLERERKAQAIDRTLARQADARRYHDGRLMALRRLSFTREEVDASGWSVDEQRVAMWIADSHDGQGNASRRRAMIAELFSRLLRQGEASSTAMVQRLAESRTKDVQAVLLCEPGKGRVWIQSKLPLNVVLLEEGGTLRTREVRGTQEIHLEPGQALIIDGRLLKNDPQGLLDQVEAPETWPSRADGIMELWLSATQTWSPNAGPRSSLLSIMVGVA